MQSNVKDSPWIPRGFRAAGAINILGILLFSRGFDNPVLSEWQPQVFSTFGQGAVILWGLAYLAVAHSYRHVKWLVAVFCLEKLVYGGVWIAWMAENSADLPTLLAASPLAGIFFTIYGPNDLFFALFFGWVFLRVHRGE
ncbi:MAG: hypothetical protein AAF657_38940 [Acidobacteriota bacterium]